MSTTTGIGRTGAWVSGVDKTGHLIVEGLLDLSTQCATLRFILDDTTGVDITKALPILEFSAALTHPNTLEISGPYGPFHELHQIPNDEPLVPQIAMQYLRALGVIQAHTPTPIRVPDLSTVTGKDAQAVTLAASVIQGHTVVGNWRALNFDIEPGQEIDFDDHYQLSVLEAFTIPVGSHEVALGTLNKVLLSVKLQATGDSSVQAVPHLNNTLHYVFAPEETPPTGKLTPVRYRPAVQVPEITNEG